MSDVVIQIVGLSKQYRLGEVSTGSLRHDINRWWHRVRGRPDPYERVAPANAPAQGAAAGRRSAPEYVWALRDVGFEVQPGEVLGIVGRNGAGKSTLLKILSRITAPTAGEVRIRGRIGALLEVGTGFHPDLTGRENVFLNGAILGMTRAEVRAKFDDIVEFSGCARYIDTPVKRYSSGMMVRLGFAVAAHLEPEILVVDEVLAVGDAEFQRKCLGKMGEVARHGRTVLFVSHNLGSIQTLCRTAVWLDGGRLVLGKDEVSGVIAAYEQSGRTDRGRTDVPPAAHRVVSPFQIVRIEILSLDGRPAASLRFGEPVRLRLVCTCTETLEGVRVGIGLRSHGVVLATLFSPDERFEASGEGHVLDCVVPAGALLPGLFELDAGASRYPGNVELDYLRSVASFTVSDVGLAPGWVHDRCEVGVVRIPFAWERGGTAAGREAAG